MAQSSLKNKNRHSKTSAAIQIPKFLTKTFEILESNKFPQALQWEKEGTAILIKGSTEIEKVLPCLFKHKNFTSFVRQLNLYGFKKLKNSFSQHIYYHEYFQSGKKNLLKFVKRKKEEASEEHSKSCEGDSDREAEERELRKENKGLKKLHQDISLRITALEDKLKQFAEQNMLLIKIAMKKENEILCLKSSLSLDGYKENSINITCINTQVIDSPETLSLPVEKYFRASGAFKPFVKSKAKPETSLFTFNCQNSAFVKVAKLKCIKDCDSDRKSEASHNQNVLVEEQRGTSPISC